MKINSIRKCVLNKYSAQPRSATGKNYLVNDNIFVKDNIYLGLAKASLKNKQIEHELKLMELI